MSSSLKANPERKFHYSCFVEDLSAQEMGRYPERKAVIQGVTPQPSPAGDPVDSVEPSPELLLLPTPSQGARNLGFYTTVLSVAG